MPEQTTAEPAGRSWAGWRTVVWLGVVSLLVDLVYEGFYHDPLKTDLEAFLASSQAMVSGDVTLRTSGGSVEAVAVRSPHLLTAKGATYAQSADWGVAEAEGFIRLYGMSSTLWAQVNRKS